MTGAQEGEKRYRVVFSQGNKPIVSNPRALQITRLPVGAAQGDFAVIEDKKTGLKFVAEQVTARFLPGVPEERIQAIVKSATQAATGQAGHVIGYLSQIRVVQVALEVDPGAPEAVRTAAVKAAVAELERYDAVRHAQPNFVFEFAQTPADGASSPQCSGLNGQWAAAKIKAPEAWEAWALAGTLSGPKVVAVVDTGVKPSSDTNGDLCWGASTAPDSARTPPNCNPVNVLGDTDLTANAEHGTQVAGIIAARHHGSASPIGLSGIAHGLPILSFDVGTSLFHDGMNRHDKILNAADTAEVGIINISVGDYTEDPDFLSALEYATCPDDRTDEEGCDCLRSGTGVTEEFNYSIGSIGSGPADQLLVITATAGGANISGNVSAPDPVTSANQDGKSIILGEAYTTDNGGELIFHGDGEYTYRPPAEGVCALVVAAAGNFGSATSPPYPSYPCRWTETEALDPVLCVANTDQNDKLYTLSNYGTWVDLTAPGTQVCTTGVSGYVAPSATSFAVPHVSGAAAVLWSMEPGLTAIEVANVLKASTYQAVCGNSNIELEETCDDGNTIDDDGCPADCGKSGSQYLNKLGSGRLDLFAAIAAANDAPVLAAIETAALVYNEDDAPTPITGTLTVSDVDNINIKSATIQITNNYQNGQDVLGFNDIGNISFGGWNSATGTLSLTGTDMLTNYQTALHAVTYVNTSNNPSTATRTVSFTVKDEGDAASNTVTHTINVTSANDPPVLAAIETLALVYNEDDAPTPITDILTVSDVDDTHIKSATVQITNNYQNGQDVLGFTNTGNISGNWTADTLTLNGPDTLVNFEAALRTVTYQNTSQNPSELPRTVSFTVTDEGDAASNTETRTINVRAENARIELQAGSNVWPGSYSQEVVLAIGNNEIWLEVPFEVKAGVVYSFGLFPAAGDLSLWSAGDSYGGGEAFFITGSSRTGILPTPDLVFEVMVQGPTATCQISATSKTHGQGSTAPNGVGQSFTACQSGVIRAIRLDVMALDNPN